MTSAVVAVKTAITLNEEFTYENAEHFFWTDSKVVLEYIANEIKHFHLSVANRVGFIHSSSNKSQWNYVPGSPNVADIASRGSSATELKESMWFVGSKFLWLHQVPVFEASFSTITESDPEVKKINSLATTASRNFELERFEHCSSWQWLKKGVALCLLFKKWLKSRVSNQPFSRSRMVTRQRKRSLYDSVSSTDMQEAELEILKQVQSNVFSRELSRLRESAVIALFKFDCFIDGNGLICVGGGLPKA